MNGTKKRKVVAQAAPEANCLRNVQTLQAILFVQESERMVLFDNDYNFQDRSGGERRVTGL